MKTIIVDASIVSKWYIEEENSNKAIEIRDLHATGKIGLAAPILLLYEVGNTFLRHPLITLEDAAKAFQALLDLGIELRSLSELDLFRTAFENARKLNVTFYDASYIALAQQYKTKFLTADKKLHDRPRQKVNAALLSEIKPENLF